MLSCRHCWPAGLGALTLLSTAVLMAAPLNPVNSPPLSAAHNGQVPVEYARRPLIFEPNKGQAPSRVEYLARGLGYGLFLTTNAAVLNLCGRDSTRDTSCTTVNVRLLGASRNVAIVGEDRVPGISNYFVGNDESKWQTSVAHFARVRYREIYPGIDLVYYGNQQQLEYDFVVASGADPDAIRLAYSGADRLFLDQRGDLHIQIHEGELVQRRPYVYQIVDGHKEATEGQFELFRNDSGIQIGFVVGSYDPGRPLIIDPVLAYSTYLGGSDFDRATSIAVDDEGNAYVTGGTGSVAFPTVNPLQATRANGSDVFVTKLDASGSIVYSTYLGGSASDEAWAIAVDNDGNAHIAGTTRSSDFPTANALQKNNAGRDAFVAKLAANGGMLLYSTYFGGSGDEIAWGIAVDTSDSAYVVGETTSQDLHTTANAFQAMPPEPEDGCYFGPGLPPDEVGRANGFAVKLDAGGGIPLYATYLGGSNADSALDVAVTEAGNAYVVGVTCSTDFPTVNPVQPENAGGAFGQDAFIAKLDATGNALLYSTYLGGSEEDGAAAVAVDRSDNAYVAGFTNSCDFPTVRALQAAIGSCGLGSDGFIAKLDTIGNRLLYSTFLGGSAGDGISGLAVDATGNVYVAGRSGSTDFPTVNPVRATQADGGEFDDVFIAQVDASGTALGWSTYLGGAGSDVFNNGPAIAVDSVGNVYVVGETNSTDFPTVSPVQEANAGFYDAFAAKIAPDREVEEPEQGGGSLGWLLLAGLSVIGTLRALK